MLKRLAHKATTYYFNTILMLSPTGANPLSCFYTRPRLVSSTSARSTKSFSFPDYKLNSNPIQVKSFYKDLGVTFSSDLSWSSHIETIITKANHTLYLIKRTFSISSPIPTKKQLYLSLVLSLAYILLTSVGALIN